MKLRFTLILLIGAILCVIPLTLAMAQSISKIAVSPRVYSLNPCEEKKFSASVKDGNGRSIKKAKVSWKSTNPDVAKIDGNGTAVGVSPGFTFIRAINGKVKSNPASVFVRDKQVVRDC